MRMNHLMRKRILQMAPIPKLIRTKLDPIIMIKPTRMPMHTPSANDIIRVQLPAQLGDILVQEANDGTVLEQVVAVFFAAGAVLFFVPYVDVKSVEFFAFGGHIVG